MTKSEEKKTKRAKLLELLDQCTEKQTNLFKRMYCKPGIHLYNESTLSEIVGRMTKGEIRRALEQTQRTVDKNNMDFVMNEFNIPNEKPKSHSELLAELMKKPLTL
jgi:hypothetical protein